jgi:hypothetical protein
MTMQPWKMTPGMLLNAQVCSRAVFLRVKGWSYADIAAELNLSSAMEAKKCTETGAAISPSDNPRTIRKIAEDQIMIGIKAALEMIADPGYQAAANGAIVRDPDTGKPQKDRAAIAAGIARLYEGNAQLRKLHGVDAPKQSVQMVLSAAEIRAMADQVMAQAEQVEREAMPSAISGRIEEPDDDALRSP